MHRNVLGQSPIAVSHRSDRIGLIAGWGRYPVIVAAALRQRGYQTFCLGIEGHADSEALRDVCHDFRWNGLARMGSAVRYFRRHGITRATMAGKIHKTIFYGPWVWLKHLPDLTAAWHFFPYFVGTDRDRKDDTLLGAVVDGFARYGITFAPATDFDPELLVKYGQLTRRGLSTAQRKDIEFGWQMAKEMGRLDIGQSVAVKNRAVLAVEAIEGTDQCIRRAGSLCESGGFTVVKVSKPNQDMRFDVPTIGLGTLNTLVESGGRVLAIEADKTIVVDQPKVVAFADRHKLVIVALDERQPMEAAA